MTTTGNELEQLYQKIVALPENDRLDYQQRLTSMIEQAEAQGQTVRAEIRLLNDELINAAIEDQFDNMPV